MLQIRDLTVTMKKDLRDLLRGFTFALNPGDKAAIIGEEGNGKSTLLKLLYDPRLGRGLCGIHRRHPKGRDAFGLPLPRGAPGAGGAERLRVLLPVPGFSGRLPRGAGRSGQAAALPPGLVLLDRLVKTFSGGGEGEAAHGPAHLGRPDCYLLDEPSNDLDIDTLDWLETFIRECAEPVLFISHDELLLERTANVILHMEQLRRKTLPRWTVAAWATAST